MKKIVENLNLPEITDTIYISDVATEQEMETAKRKMLTISEAAHLIDGIREYRIRQDVLHLLFNLGKCTGQLRSFKAGNKYLIAENDLYEAVFGKSSCIDNGGAA